MVFERMPDVVNETTKYSVLFDFVYAQRIEIITRIYVCEPRFDIERLLLN